MSVDVLLPDFSGEDYSELEQVLGDLQLAQDDDVLAERAARGIAEPARRARASGTELLKDVRWRVVVAQGLIEHGEVGEAFMVLEDLEYDLDAVIES